MRPILILCAGLLLAPTNVTADPAPRLVEIGLYLVDITNLDELNETFTADFDVVSRWQDPARAFAPVPGEKIPRLHGGAAAEAFLAGGWQPALFAQNMVAAVNDREMRILVTPDGTVTLRLRVVRVLRAPLDFRAFPFDRQVLPVHIESFLYDADALTIEPEVDFTGFDTGFEMAEWRVVDFVTERHVRERVQENEQYDQLSFLVQLERRSGYYVWKIMLPMVVIVMLSWIVFWMSDEMLGRRAGVSSTGMLTVIAYQFIVSGTLPRFAYLTVMDHFTIASLLVIAATMLVNLVGSRLEKPARLRLDRACRGVFPVVYLVLIGYVVVRSGG